MKDNYIIEELKEYCRDDVEVDAIYKALELALYEYQWQYQNASEKQYRDVSKSTSQAIDTTIKHLMDCGLEQLADEVLTALEDDGNILTKSKFLTKAKKTMKKHLVSYIGEPRYNRNLSVLLGEAFIEHCKKYPLKYAPVHIEGNLQKQQEQERYEDLQPLHPYK